jgi:hypothetical protein
MNEPLFTERETWLTEAVALMQDEGLLPHAIPDWRVSVGLAGGRLSAKTPVRVFDPSASESGHWEIFVSPTIAEPSAALAALATGMFAAVNNTTNVRGKRFQRRLANRVGVIDVDNALWGDLCFYGRDDDVATLAKGVSGILGAYPHAAMRPENIRKQKARLAPLHCGCGWKVQATATQVVSIDVARATCMSCHAPAATMFYGDTPVSEFVKGNV